MTNNNFGWTDRPPLDPTPRERVVMLESAMREIIAEGRSMLMPDIYGGDTEAFLKAKIERMIGMAVKAVENGG